MLPLSALLFGSDARLAFGLLGFSHSVFVITRELHNKFKNIRLKLFLICQTTLQMLDLSRSTFTMI